MHLGRCRQCGLLLGEPGFYLLPVENPSLSNAQNGLEKAERHQNQEKVLTSFRQLLFESPLLPPLVTDRGGLPTGTAGSLGLALTNQS